MTQLTATEIDVLQVLFDRAAAKKGATSGTLLQKEIGLEEHDDGTFEENMGNRSQLVEAVRKLYSEGLISPAIGGNWLRKPEEGETVNPTLEDLRTETFSIMSSRKKDVGSMLFRHKQGMAAK